MHAESRAAAPKATARSRSPRTPTFYRVNSLSTVAVALTAVVVVVFFQCEKFSEPRACKYTNFPRGPLAFATLKSSARFIFPLSAYFCLSIPAAFIFRVYARFIAPPRIVHVFHHHAAACYRRRACSFRGLSFWTREPKPLLLHA